MPRLDPRLRRALACLAACLGGLPALGQTRILETRTAALSGFASAPSLALAPSLLLTEGYDAEGRLVLLGTAGKEETGKEGRASPNGLFRAFRYDRKGRIGLILESAEPGGAPLFAIQRFYDEGGWLARVEAREGGSLSARLEIGYEGSGEAGYAFLLSAEGELLEAATFILGGGAAEAALLSLSLSGPAGESRGSLELDYDAAGRLSRYERRGPSLEAAEGGGEGGRKEAAGDRGKAPKAGSVDILSLLFPFWPGEAPSFELAALLALGPRQAWPRPASPFASGFSGLPFGRPEEGRADFLYDERGRLLGASLFGPRISGPEVPGEGLQSLPLENSFAEFLMRLEYRYDEAGFLVEELRQTAAETLSILRVYRLGTSGSWLESSSFLRVSGSGLAILSPLEYRERRQR